MADTEITPAERGRLAALDRLQPAEVLEYEKQCRSGKPDLSLDVNKRLYELFLNGMSLANMIELNPGFTQGMLLKARVDGRWDERRDAYLGELLGGVPARVKQMAAEALGFMTLQLSVAHKMHGEKMRRYLQTGDPKDLGELVPSSFRDYKSVIESITRLLDAGKPKGGEGSVSPVNLTVNAPGGSVNVQEGPGRRFTAEEADAIRASIERK